MRRPGNYEVELGIPTRELIYGLAGGPEDGHEIKAFYPGGSSSPVLTAGRGLDLPYSFEAMAEAGSMLGSGSIIVADDRVSIPHMALRTARFYHHESCGKCTPCREGTNWTVKMLERVVRGEATPMDLDIVSSVQENIIGHCLCVLGDSMAMPVGAMVRKFRDEFEEVMADAGSALDEPHVVVQAPPRPWGRRHERRQREVTLTIDGREVTATEGEMLHDAARKGDVEIPVFCYEPKLGEPVGACRMCLVEIEGIPKLQTSCSTPVRDGMVVHTRTEQVKHAQNAVVEFLLVNHPLDCPVCDKGGECPLQDITQGWGPGKSRVIDEKRHFEKPIELSPLVAIDRERCILCYRCVRFSQEVSEDAAAAAARARRPHLRRHLRRPPLRRPLPRQHHRPLPGRRADQLHLPLPRPALGHRAGRLGLHALPEPVQRQLHGPRREGETGDRPRQPRGRRRLALRPRPLRLRDVRRRGAGRRAAAAKAAPRSAGSGRSRRRPRGCSAAGGARSRRSSATPPTRRATWSSACCARRSARRTSTRAPRAAPAARRCVRLAQPELSARVRDIDDADVILVLGTDPLHSSPILDLRVRKAIRRNGARLAVATERPTALDGGAEAIARYAPGEGAHFLAELARRGRRRRERRHAAGREPARAPARSSSSGASGSPARATAPRPCSTSPRRSASPAPTAPACSKSPTSPTPAACARPAACPTPARASATNVHCRRDGKHARRQATEEIRAALSPASSRA